MQGRELEFSIRKLFCITATLESGFPPLADRRHVALVPPFSNRINAVGRGAWRDTRGRVASSSGGVCCCVAQPQRLEPVSGSGPRLRTRPWQLTGSSHRPELVVALQPGALGGDSVGGRRACRLS